MSNVKHVDITTLTEEERTTCYWNASLNWMPYVPELLFNQACCPLKLFSGIASGQPIMSADIPECRLYPDWVRIYKTADEAVQFITDTLETADTENAQIRRNQQVQFAKQHTWSLRAESFSDILESQHLSTERDYASYCDNTPG